MLKHKAHVDLETKASVLQSRKKKIMLSVDSTMQSKKQSTPSKCLFAMQFKKALRKGVNLVLIHLSKIGDEDSTNDLGGRGGMGNPLLEEYKDVFEPLPKGLPLEREIGPPFRPIYTLNPLELEKAQRQIKEHLEKG